MSCIALERPASVRKHLPNLSESWLVDNYWVGPENEGLRYLFDEYRLRDLANISPIVIYGEQSLGKTALAITLAVRWSRVTEQRPLVITTGEGFCSEYAAAVEIDDIDSFRRKYRLCKMLVIDGMDAVAEKSAAQDELSATLDFLHDAHRPCLLTNCILPASLKNIYPSLASRLSSGFSMQLLRPGKITRRALIESLVSKLDPLIPVDLLYSIADEFSASVMTPLDIRDLVKLAQQNRSVTGELNCSVVSLLMKQQLLGVAPTIANITKSVCRRLHVKLVDVRSTSRESNIVRARSVSIYLTRKLTTLSLLQIGEYFSGRDHSTIIHSVRKIASLIESDGQLANLCRDVESELLNHPIL